MKEYCRYSTHDTAKFLQRFPYLISYHFTILLPGQVWLDHLMDTVLDDIAVAFTPLGPTLGTNK